MLKCSLQLSLMLLVSFSKVVLPINSRMHTMNSEKNISAEDLVDLDHQLVIINQSIKSFLNWDSYLVYLFVQSTYHHAHTQSILLLCGQLTSR